jgi:hypothetical protein
MKKSVYLTAATIAALTACKPTTVVENNTVATGAGTTANVAANEVGVDNNVTSTGTIDTNLINGTTEESQPSTTDNTTNY